MLVVITFQAYLSISAAVLLLYYTALYFRYRKAPVLQPATTAPVSEKKTKAHENLQSSVHDLVDELENCISSYTGEKQHLKADVSPALQSLVRMYPELHETQFVEPINHLIVLGCQKHLNIHLTTEDLETLWQ